MNGFFNRFVNPNLNLKNVADLTNGVYGRMLQRFSIDAPAIPATPSIVLTGLQAYFKYTVPVAALGIWPDETGNGNNAHLLGDAVVSTEGLICSRTGMADLTNVTLPNSSSAQWTVSFWVKKHNATFFDLCSSAVVFNGCGVVLSNTPGWRPLKNDSVRNLAPVGTQAAINVWQHVNVLGGSGITTSLTDAVYINKVKQTVTGSSDNGYGLNSLYRLGGGYSSSKLLAILDHVMIYNRHLNEAEIVQNYSATMKG
jgi:hypothetical protein